MSGPEGSSIKGIGTGAAGYPKPVQQPAGAGGVKNSMSYQVLARKWRPPQFEAVAGQESVTRTLENALRSGRIAHAFLFTGVRGVGKTTTARILAKALNCHEGITPHPCDQCVSCQEIAQSNSVDVQEIDAASNTSVDDVREIRESVQYGAARDRFKIFIIDEVHMLSRAAFNALLKTLEEPPSHVKFILATTELHKIPVTITSRCQQYEFRPIPSGVIRERLSHLCREENVEISDYGLNVLATVARGSMRDAQSALDRILALCGSKIDDEEIRTVLGLMDETVLAELVRAVADRDRKGILNHICDLQESGADAANLSLRFLQFIRSLMICRVAGWDARLLQLPDSDRPILIELSERFTELDLIRFYDLLETVSTELKVQADPFLHLEMGLMKLVELAGLPRIEEVIQQLQTGERPLPPASASPPPTRPTPSRGAPSVRNEKARPAEDPSPASTPGPAKSTGEGVAQLMEAIQHEKMSLFSLLQSASSVELAEGRLEVVFPANEAFAFSMVSRDENRDFLLRAGAAASVERIEVKLEDAPSKIAPDPLQDKNVQTFLKEFPSKYTVDRED